MFYKKCSFPWQDFWHSRWHTYFHIRAEFWVLSKWKCSSKPQINTVENYIGGTSSIPFWEHVSIFFWLPLYPLKWFSMAHFSPCWRCVLPPSTSEALDKALLYSWIEPSEILRIKKWWLLAAKNRDMKTLIWWVLITKYYRWIREIRRGLWVRRYSLVI